MKDEKSAASNHPSFLIPHPSSLIPHPEFVMITDLLLPFRPDAHRLILVEDADGLLDDETARATLLGRGYRLVEDDGDPARLRHELGSLSDGGPLIVLTRRPLRQLPYDLWAAAHHLSLSLARLYPNLNATVLRGLTGREARWRLGRAAPPLGRLGREATADYLLRVVYEVDPAQAAGPAALLAWLARYHADLPGPMPADLRRRWLDRLSAAPAFAGLPLAALLDDRAAFAAFVTAEWAGYLSATTGQSVAEPKAAYHLDFTADTALQDALPGLLRRGALARLTVREPAALPEWALAAVRSPDEDDRRRWADDLQERLAEQSAELIARPQAGRWAGWAAVAQTWAELTGLALTLNDETLNEAMAGRQRQLDVAFAGWLEKSYAALAGRKLPQPHHVHHAPHLMAYDRRTGGRPVALLVLDGLSLADWRRIQGVWAARHPAWSFAERGPLLAQIPTITAVSRQALVSGRRPAEFAASLADNRKEAAHWTAFWAGEGLSGAQIAYDRLQTGRPFAPDSRAAAQCLIYSGLDDILHGATQGAAEAWASLGVWLDGAGREVEAAIDRLLAAGYAVYLTSDHGHVEAWGMGQPREGEAAESRGKRSRLYRAREAAAAQQAKHPRTRLWHDDGLLPDNLVALLPDDAGGRVAFAPEYARVIAHGGLTLDEVVVPLVVITN